MNSPSFPRIIRSEDDDAVTQLQAKIAAAEKLQATMKAANLIVRSPRLTDDEKVARFHLEKFGAELTELSAEQASYIGVTAEGPFKPEHYRY